MAPKASAAAISKAEAKVTKAEKIGQDAQVPERFQKMIPSNQKKDSRSYFEHIQVDGREVQIRCFRPAATEDKEARPAIVMVCGLLWFGDGLLGQIGLKFNDGFGYAFAKAGVPCVQVHTPIRHIGMTRFMDFLVFLLFPLTLLPTRMRAIICMLDVAFLAQDILDFLPVLLMIFFLPNWGPWALPVAHLATRNLQLLRGMGGVGGMIPGPERRDHQKEIAAVVAWVQEKENQDKLGSDGRLVLCGYSSGGHCAALYGLSPQAPKFEAVVLISAVLNLQTDLWEGSRRWLKPLFDTIYGDILGCRTPDERRLASPEAMVEKKVGGQDWYVLSAKTELLGLQPLQDILFQAAPFCKALESKGAKVHRVTCGHNHWLLIFSISNFLGPFCKNLLK